MLQERVDMMMGQQVCVAHEWDYATAEIECVASVVGYYFDCIG